MKSRFISMLCVTATIFASSAVLAETVIVVECPTVFTENPFTLLRVENGEGWEKSESSGYKSYKLSCRNYINPQGYMTCYYKPVAAGAPDVYMFRKMPTANTVCKESKEPSISCKFECTPKQSSQQPVKIQPVKKR